MPVMTRPLFPVETTEVSRPRRAGALHAPADCLARGRLELRLQHKIEPEDVVQSAFKSFFLRYGEGALWAEGWDGLWDS